MLEKVQELHNMFRQFPADEWGYKDFAEYLDTSRMTVARLFWGPAEKIRIAEDTAEKLHTRAKELGWIKGGK